MTTPALPPTTDDDEAWLFERTVQALQRTYGCAEAEAIELLNRYHIKFTDADFCDAYDMSAQTTEFFHREESLTMADRIYFYEALGNEPDEAAFIRWQRKIRL
ncbi:hypothetical protein ACFFTM_07875 [Pseudoduganella plicata]|uniref:Uncharacterized protein n=1 Tax=Pseudoduganella plicata TaxID=321984 RepID=A0A4P7BJE1_9BURK|nr:hypothetical protein [Pseudoduganella plicata]QBQ38277.1 hypothetical protein E1742_20440 [Pseudoduganella plicata]GGY80787.1 hypothetical protein GCM10007388_11840 [Pseudoduganella plicata]